MTKTYPMVSFRCDEQFRRLLKREAKRQNISIGQLIRRALTEEALQCQNDRK